MLYSVKVSSLAGRVAMLSAALCAAPSAFAQSPLAPAPGAPTAAVSGEAQDPQAALRAQIELLRQQLEALQQKVAMLEAAGAQRPAAPAAAPPAAAPPAGVEVPPGAAGAGGAAGSLPVYGNPSAMSKIFNPDIGMIGNFLSAVGQSRGGSIALSPVPSMTLQESEASFQAIVDPYARADFFLALGEQGIEVEEGFVTFPSLPGGLLVKVGKMRAAFGRLNAFHNHTLPWTDRPLVMYNLLGGASDDPDTGIKDAGVSVSRIIPAGKLFLEATGEVFRGDSGTLFRASQRKDVSTVDHLRAYTDLTESSNLEVGASYARGHNDTDADRITQLYGADVTYRWKPLARSIYHSFVARSELMWSRRQTPLLTDRAFGMFASADYQLARRWVAGGRVDWAERGREASIRDRGVSAVLTLWPTEFSQVRGQYRRTRFGDKSQPANEFFFQVLFTIGAHGAHVF